MITYEEIAENIVNDKYTKQHLQELPLYKPNHVFDVNKTVRWNQDQIIEKNEEIKELNKRNATSDYERTHKRRTDMIEYVQTYGYSEAQAKEIVRFAGNRTSYSYIKTLSNVEDLIKSLADFKECSK